MTKLFTFRSHGCPWSFVHHLALQLGSHVAPEGTFHHLKLGLLLSLAASKTDPEVKFYLLFRILHKYAKITFLIVKKYFQEIEYKCDFTIHKYCSKIISGK